MGNILLVSSITLFMCGSAAYAQIVPGNSIELRDEGGAQGRVKTLDCVGLGISCSVSGSVGTINGSGGGGGAPTGYAYWGSGTDATLSAEINLAALSTGLLINTTGTPSAYGGATCTNQVIRLLSASGAATCQTITSAYVDSSLAVSARQILTSAPLTGGGDLTADRTISFASQSANTILAAPNGAGGSPAFRALVDADIPNTITIDLASTASSLAANGGNCTGNNFALGVDASGIAECAQPAFSNLSGSATDSQIPDTISLTNLTQIGTRQISDTTGTLSVGRGGTGQTTITANQVYIGTALDTVAPKSIPSCSNGTTSKLLFNSATQEFSCGTDQGGGGGGGNVVEVEVDFGSIGDTTASTIVTGQAWVTSSSVIVCSPTMISTVDRSEGAEDAIIEGLTFAPHTRVVSTGFTVSAHVANGTTRGRYKCHCTGV